MSRPLLIAHDLSWTGAPIALLSLAKALRRLGEDPLIVPLRDGPLREGFVAAGFELASGCDPNAIAFVLANTLVAVPTALRFKRYGIRCAAWIHESTYFFTSRTILPGKYGLERLDVALFPTRFQIDEFGPFLARGSAYQLHNMAEQEWFRPPGEAGVLAVVGPWVRRKGQAKLLRLAQRMVDPWRFKFIGASRPVDIGEDLLRPVDRFLGPVSPTTARFEIATAGALLSVAEAEVQPLSVVEALMAGRPVLLSDIPAHRALASELPGVFLFDPSSQQSFDHGIGMSAGVVSDVALARESSTAAHAAYGQTGFDRRVSDILRILRGDTSADPAVCCAQRECR